ncbi:MAG: outer membrane beta-barrel domain-containing protein [Gammaproteobacteria bacterium]|nr:outer membrane beta-barrel domain-containing protein [Gammaproteobacteria bacterium]
MPVTQVAAQSDEEEQTNLIEPQIERIEFDESQIDSDDFEISVYAGYLAIEDFGTNFVTGFKFGYHVSEDFFVQASYGNSEAGETSFEILSGGAPLLSESERELEYYLISIGYNLFPGEAFLTDSTTFNTVFYISGGVGTTTFAGDDRFTIAYAAGHRTIFTDGFSLDIEMRDLVFDLDVFGSEKSTNNLEFSVSLNLFF